MSSTVRVSPNKSCKGRWRAGRKLHRYNAPGHSAASDYLGSGGVPQPPPYTAPICRLLPPTFFFPPLEKSALKKRNPSSNPCRQPPEQSRRRLHGVEKSDSTINAYRRIFSNFENLFWRVSTSLFTTYLFDISRFLFFINARYFWNVPCILLSTLCTHTHTWIELCFLVSWVRVGRYSKRVCVYILWLRNSIKGNVFFFFKGKRRSI